MASSAFWNAAIVLVLYLSAGREMTSASILLKLHGLEGGVFDPKGKIENLTFDSVRGRP